MLQRRNDVNSRALGGFLAVVATAPAGRFTAPLVGGGTWTGAGIATVLDYNGGVLIR